MLTVRQVLDLADRMPEPRFRVMVLLAAFASLRWGEVSALRRCDIDVAAGTVSVRRQHVELDTGELIATSPKSAAGVRTVAIPDAILGTVREYLESCDGQSPDALVFTGGRGGVLRRSNFRRAVGWSTAVAAVGAPGLHVHDLRHTGNTLAAAGGARLRDLMDRMGHDSIRAAMIYQHATTEASRLIADSISGMIQRVQSTDDGASPPGSQARQWHGGPVNEPRRMCLCWWAQAGSNHRPLACNGCHHHSPTSVNMPLAQVRCSSRMHERAAASCGEHNALPNALPSHRRVTTAASRAPPRAAAVQRMDQPGWFGRSAAGQDWPAAITKTWMVVGCGPE